MKGSRIEDEEHGIFQKESQANFWVRVVAQDPNFAGKHIKADCGGAMTCPMCQVRGVSRADDWKTRVTPERIHNLPSTFAGARNDRLVALTRICSCEWPTRSKYEEISHGV